MAQDRSAAQDAPDPPFGIGGQHFEPRHPPWLRTVLSLLLIGVPLALSFTGLLGDGGGRPGTTTAATAAIRLSVETPRVLRSGNWFESRITVVPAQDIADLAIEIDDPLWRGMSIDTIAPDAEKSESLGGTFTYSFGPVRRGERFVLKLDGQIQPRWLRRLTGRIMARDGERTLAEVPVAITVLP